MYQLIFSSQAKEDLSRLKKDEPQAFKKASKLLGELVDHPFTGSGKPEALRGNRSGQWSRRISQSLHTFMLLDRGMKVQGRGNA